MNIKKYLEQQAKKDAERLLTDADREYCKKLAEEIVKKFAQKQAEK